MRHVLAGLGALIGAIGAVSAADPAANTFTASATLLKNCTTSATGLAFGNYTPTGGAVAATSTVSVNCTRSTGFTVALNKGATTGGTIVQRLMTDGAGHTLQYNLYTTASLASIWGDTTGGSVTQAGTGTGMATPVNFTVYGSLPDNATNQAVPPNAYADTITVSVSY